MYKIEALLLPSKNNMVILGTNFMISERAIINYRDGFINFGGVNFEISSHNRLTEPKSMLISTYSYCSAVLYSEEELKLNHAKSKISRHINDYMEEISKIGEIPNMQQEDSLKFQNIKSLIAKSKTLAFPKYNNQFRLNVMLLNWC